MVHLPSIIIYKSALPRNCLFWARHWSCYLILQSEILKRPLWMQVITPILWIRLKLPYFQTSSTKNDNFLSKFKLEKRMDHNSKISSWLGQLLVWNTNFRFKLLPPFEKIRQLRLLLPKILPPPVKIQIFSPPKRSIFFIRDFFSTNTIVGQTRVKKFLQIHLLG